MQETGEIPKFNLAEQIMAEQRKITCQASPKTASGGVDWAQCYAKADIIRAWANYC